MALIAHVEDNEGDHVLLAHTLKSWHTLIHFRDVAALTKSQQSFDLIIADLGLPQSFGMETLHMIRKKFPTMPIIALTGLGGPYITGDLIKNLMNAGANNVVSKEIMCDSRMLDIIDEHLS